MLQMFTVAHTLRFTVAQSHKRLGQKSGIDMALPTGIADARGALQLSPRRGLIQHD
jgi:hypothetical protein